MDANDENGRAEFSAQLRLAVAFLTRLPVAHAADDDDPLAVLDETPPDLASAMWLFPLVGFAIGGAGALALGALVWGGVPAPVAATLAIGVMIWLTGALHEDGLSDIADGFGGGSDRDHKLEIMRDSRLGAYGTVTLAIVVVTKIAALATIAAHDVGAAAGALIAATVWSRALIAPTMRWLTPARDDGLGANAGEPTEGDSWKGLGLAVLLVLLVLVTPAGFGVVTVLLAGGLAAFAVGMIALRQIGGYTGDVLGAVVMIAETAALVAASAIVSGSI
ncbi:MAG: adenosylcobinamide-GDP ribazoletransferase [Rhodospirillaceae bacterium]|jgi:adenosylcobinamide-GDP ribazoletransferase|nr:adenosylcobinamide-GDP ribazoletransferase [Rhodospirillaceae bacterium]MBT4772795.1 adenosylcobinamide-GDP ribazoletransferase [Rhodospirillaceae bacterium]MBT5360043.1 adenosylcobinamide-GDP ribazoletransferase [Rhodospirillaceae bacterium]MBT5770973.1 adenosylcobinamide-GDP ribazoletransferase [Rhodospirillaceae bacterium]MBT6309274.1 adenosylcobinamide-GDP ribazoletransferase [Rhodospirillaceae bacterium]